MKNSYLRTGVALACAFGLVACGGGDDDQGDRPLTVRLVNVNKLGLKLTNNGGAAVDVAPGDSAVLGNLAYDSTYDIKLVTGAIPSNALSCEVLNGQGNNAYSQLAPVVGCILKTFALTGTVSGLTAPLVINNGAVQVTIPANATTFSMSAEGSTVGQVAEGVPYGLTVLVQPPSPARPCTITRGDGLPPTGIMPNAAVADFKINCI